MRYSQVSYYLRLQHGGINNIGISV